MARYRLARKPLPEVTLSEFLQETGLTLAQINDRYDWPIDTLKSWSAKQGPSSVYHRQLLAYVLMTDLPEIKALLDSIK